MADVKLGISEDGGLGEKSARALGWSMANTILQKRGAWQLVDVLHSAPARFDYVCLHPIPNPTAADDPERGFMARVAREVLPPVRAALAAQK